MYNPDEHPERRYNPSLKMLMEDCSDATNAVQELLGGLPNVVSFSVLTFLIHEAVMEFHGKLTARQLELIGDRYREICDASPAAADTLRGLMTLAWQSTVKGDFASQMQSISKEDSNDTSDLPEKLSDSCLNDLCSKLFNQDK